MNDGRDRNYISIGHWMLLLLLAAIPCFGMIFVLVMAFVGENESRKNYFRAILLWMVIVIGAVLALSIVAGGWNQIREEIQRRVTKG